MSKEITSSEKIAEEIVNIMLDNENCQHELVEQWLENNQYAQRIISNLTDGDNLRQNIKNFNHNDKFTLANKLKVDIKKRKRKSLIIRSWSAVASLLAISALLYAVNDYDKVSPKLKGIISIDQTVQNNPMIILSNGEVVDITKINEKSIEFENNQVNINDITRVLQSNSLEEKNRLNRFIVPNKYTAKFELCDGTIVHLNSSSELYFPTKFEGDTRRVELKGEGYFEVKKSDKMFIVSVNGVDVKVYGTKFNICSYEKNIIKTVLIDGSVGVTTEDGQEIKLLPNELCCVNKSENTISTEMVNIQKYVAWVQGTFMYEKDSFKDLIQELSRWYEVDFVFLDQELENLSITAIFSKKMELSEILEIVQMLDLNIIFTQKEGRYYIERK